MPQLEAGYYTVRSGFPLVLAKSVGPLREEHVREMAAIFDAAMERREPYIIIVDGRGPMAGDARYRRAVAEYANRNAPIGRHYLVASIIVLDSTIARMVLTAIQWLHQTPARQDIVSNVQDAAALAEELWTAKQGPIPADMASLLELVHADRVEYVRAIPRPNARAAG